MFFLAKYEHKLHLPPHLLKLPLKEAIMGELGNLFLDKVIQKMGLCISIYDILNIEGGIIAPGEGAATYTVEFRLIMFCPYEGEVITATIMEADAVGLRLSLGFFDDIYVPADLFPKPSSFEPHPDKEECMIWVYTYEEQKLQAVVLEEILFRVQSIIYPTIPIEQKEGSKPFAPMHIVGAIDDCGLGPVDWW